MYDAERNETWCPGPAAAIATHTRPSSEASSVQGYIHIYNFLV